MSRFPRLALALLSCSLFNGHALADDYTVAIGTPITGTSIPPGRIGLGIPVSVEKSWEKLSSKEQLAWREYTELIDPQITPPFPQPNIRALLMRLERPPELQVTDRIQTKAQVLLVIRISETGTVHAVNVMRGAVEGAAALTPEENVLAVRYAYALTNTRFSPAKMNGQAVPCAIPMLVSESTKMY
jgi:hypothetical protein